VPSRRTWALTFPDVVDVADETIALFPELRALLHVPPAADAVKRQLLVDEIHPTTVVEACRPAALVFPRAGSGARSALTPMDADTALLELPPNVLLTEPRAAQAHLDMLTALVRGCPCYRLQTERDWEHIASRLRSLIDRY
jgi:hypothetical protein